jgi:hypothetical protein
MSAVIGSKVPMALFQVPDVADGTDIASLGGQSHSAWSLRSNQESSHSSPATQSVVT